MSVKSGDFFHLSAVMRVAARRGARRRDRRRRALRRVGRSPRATTGRCSATTRRATTRRPTRRSPPRTSRSSVAAACGSTARSTRRRSTSRRACAAATRSSFTTTYGRTEALDASTGRVLWRFTPSTYARLAGSAQITNATPALSTDRTAVYAAAPDGRIRKLRLSDGHVLWTTRITFDPTHEKLTSSLNVFGGRVIATTGGYIGDAPPYQGHVVTMSESTGRIAHVWNSLCSDRHALIVPRTCASSDSAIWSRNGAAVDPANGDARRRDRQRAVRRQDRLGRQRARALAGRVAAAAPLDAGRPRAPEHGRPRPRLDEPGVPRRRPRGAGRQGREAAAAQPAPPAGAGTADRRRAADAAAAGRPRHVQRAGGVEGQVGVLSDGRRHRGAAPPRRAAARRSGRTARGGTSPVRRRATCSTSRAAER